MVWVIDGTRLKKDSSRFLKGKDNFHIEKEGIFAVDSPEKYFPVNWLGSSVPVIFDFRSNELADEHKDIKNHLYCLFPERVEGDTILAEITFKAFINATINGEWSSRVYHCINNVAQLRKERKIAGELKLQQDRKAWEEYLGEDIEYRKSFR